MPFGIKNANATYQCLIDKIFKEQIGNNMEVYVDDMVVKSNDAEPHACDLEEIFAQIRKYNMRLDPEKIVFRVGGEIFLGFMLSHRGIQENSDKCQVVIDIRSPKNIKEIQRIIGQIASLTSFLPNIAEKAKHIMNLLKRAKDSNGIRGARMPFKH